MEERPQLETPKRKRGSNNQNNGEISSTVLPPIPAINQLNETIKEQVQGHYIAQIIYKDLQENLDKRERLAQEIEAKIHNIKAQIKLLVANQDKLQPQIEELIDKEKEFQQQRLSGVQAWEEQITDIDRQIEELQIRRAEIEQQQLVWLADQETTQAEIQSDIDQLQQQNDSILTQQQELEEQIRLLPIPEELPSLDNRITDLIFHICSIFQPASIEHPSAEVAFKETTPGIIAPPIYYLDPWTAEDNQGLTMINIPLGAKQIILSLNLTEGESVDSYNAELYSSNGRRVWNKDKLASQGESINLTFNVTFFLSDDYELRVRGRNASSKHVPVAEYYFHISKK
jgi:hypothetical protein